MSAFDRLSDDYPHGTTTGYENGCKGGACPAPVACRDMYVRYQGDYAFRRRIDQGETPADIIASEQPVEAPRPVKVARVRTPKSRATAASVDSVNQHGATVTRLNQAGHSDRVIAAALGIDRATVARIRAAIGLTPAPLTHAATAARRQTVIDQHAEGRTDAEIADQLGVSDSYVRRLRREAGLTANPRRTVIEAYGEQIRELASEGHPDGVIARRLGLSASSVHRARTDMGIERPNPSTGVQRAAHTPRHEREKAVRDLHAQGLTDYDIAARVGLSLDHARTVRRSAGLTANRVNARRVA